MIFGRGILLGLIPISKAMFGIGSATTLVMTQIGALSATEKLLYVVTAAPVRVGTAAAVEAIH